MDSVSLSNPLTRTHAFVLLVVWAISASYMATHLKSGWVPHDEGTLGLSAERVLHGELPHRDFDDYTGGLTFVHALAFREFGTSSGSMRAVLFAFFLLWVPAVFYVASRFVSVYSAGAVTLLAVAWSVPHYPAPMPSWYNLFFATFGVATLLRYVEIDGRHWLFFAGICGGLSLLAKVTAAYFIAGVLLFFIFREQSIALRNNLQEPARLRSYSAAIIFALAVFLGLLFRLVHKIPEVSGLIYFFLPACALVVLLVFREFAGISGQNRSRFLTLARMCVPFGAGIVIPLIVFLAPYLITGSVHDLLQGLVATPTRAIRFATFAPQNPFLMLTIVPVMLPVVLAFEWGRVGQVVCGCLLALYCGAVVVTSSQSTSYNLGWCSAATLTPWIIIAGVGILWVSRKHENLNAKRQQQLFLILSVTALCSLLQFPFAAPIYFLYVAPLVILAATALFSLPSHPPRLALATVIGFYLLFAFHSITPFQLAFWSSPAVRIEPLTVARASGLRVESSDARLYNELIPLLQRHAAGKFIYAAPDSPEVYFLSGLESPTRHYFDYAEDARDYAKRTLSALDRLNVNVVAINGKPQFSGPMSPALHEALEERFPYSAELGKFQVRWKE
jgi:hypothetical protein